MRNDHILRTVTCDKSRAAPKTETANANAHATLTLGDKLNGDLSRDNVMLVTSVASLTQLCQYMYEVNM